MTSKIAVLVGSLRKDSLNRKIAKALISLAPKSLSFEMINIGDLPLYNQDFDDEGNVPAAWKTFRDQVKSCAGVMFVTPEYNRSVPGVLKNAIDVGSRPYGKSVWGGKPGLVVSVSPGAIGGFGANHHLRQMLVFLDVPTVQQPETYIGQAADLLDANGNIVKDDTKKYFQTIMDTYAAWVQKLLGTHV